MKKLITLILLVALSGCALPDVFKSQSAKEMLRKTFPGCRLFINPEDPQYMIVDDIRNNQVFRANLSDGRTGIFDIVPLLHINSNDSISLTPKK